MLIFKGTTTRKHLKEGHAKRKKIATLSKWLTARLLWAHIGELAL
jgi:hypothetical protein